MSNDDCNKFGMYIDHLSDEIFLKIFLKDGNLLLKLTYQELQNLKKVINDFKYEEEYLQGIIKEKEVE